MAEHNEDPMRLWTGSWSPTKVQVPSAPKPEKADESAQVPEDPKRG
ncbi:MAG: hypothetical protein ACRDGN_14565 [bacterium]